MWGALEHLHSRFPFKWVRAENIHLSLKFLGEVADTRESQLCNALRRAAGGRDESRPLTLQITGFGVFPDYRRPHVVWAGVTPEPALELLQHTVAQTFAPLGFPTEARTFRPHVTLARAGRDARPRTFLGVEEALRDIAFDETITVADAELMASTLQPGGPVYQVKCHERLS
ncbi:MAG: RNA 2',3'-cyclic phosphodiesterase [Gemmatimonadales bacterium]